mgnify:CR=1 FL=1
MNNNNQKYKTIGEVAIILDLKKNDGKPNTHTLRFWEKQFKIVKPKIFNTRRYYNIETIKILKKIKFLLKNKGMTINGVKKQLKLDDSELDDINNKTIRRKFIKTKLNKISSLIKIIKSNG